ncbi:hypothetical protein Leryth_025268 [Lithospermum erythrorhizon]|nr:hypothetical protein Leryth_025268 [Lithospermum erythrorhizon]
MHQLLEKSIAHMCTAVELRCCEKFTTQKQRDFTKTYGEQSQEIYLACPRICLLISENA